MNKVDIDKVLIEDIKTYIRDVHERYYRMPVFEKSTYVMRVFHAAKRLVQLLDEIEKAKAQK